MKTLVWLHPDCLSLEHPGLLPYRGAEAVFVFDEGEIEAEQWSLKRIAFLYESLLELPVTIERGDVVERLLARDVERIVTVASVNPRFGEQVRQLERVRKVEVLPAVAFVDYRGSVDLKRFSRYWKRVEGVVFGQ
jgi:hypothetical protein